MRKATPEINFIDLITLINNALFRVQSYMNGILKEYQYFGFKDVFSRLFCEAIKEENYTLDTCKLVIMYWQILDQIKWDIGLGEYKYEGDIFENEDFHLSYGEIVDVWGKTEEFENFITENATDKDHRYSIVDILDIINNKYFPQSQPFTPTKTILRPQLLTKLTTNQLEKLFDSLVDGKFIPVTTNKDCFNWAFGSSNNRHPEKWQPIIWLKNKQLLREFLTSFKNSEFIIADIERIVPLLFIDLKANPFRLAKNRTAPSLDSDLIAEITKKIATA